MGDLSHTVHMPLSPMTTALQNHDMVAPRSTPDPLLLRLPLIAFLILGGVLLWRFVGPSVRQVDPGDLERRTVTPRGDLAEDEKSTIELFEKAAPTVVFITTTQRVREGWWQTRERAAGTGSGFVWNEEGYIVTNFHVIQPALRLEAGRRWVPIGRAFVRFQRAKEDIAARIVGVRPAYDLAVLKIDPAGLDLDPIPIGRSEGLRVGQKVFAIGNPFGLDHTLTTGVVSALEREIESVARTTIRGAIQTDAAINPGNSGGPLLDSAGRLIGVNTAIYSPSGASAGIGFAIPVDTVQALVPEIIGIPGPGIGIVSVIPAVNRREGVRGLVFGGFTEDSRAPASGLKPSRIDARGEILEDGDLIMSIAGRETRGVADIKEAIQDRRPGDRVPVRVWRQGQQLDLELELIQIEPK